MNLCCDVFKFAHTIAICHEALTALNNKSWSDNHVGFLRQAFALSDQAEDLLPCDRCWERVASYFAQKREYNAFGTIKRTSAFAVAVDLRQECIDAMNRLSRAIDQYTDFDPDDPIYLLDDDALENLDGDTLGAVLDVPLNLTVGDYRDLEHWIFVDQESCQHEPRSQSKQADEHEPDYNAAVRFANRNRDVKLEDVMQKFGIKCARSTWLRRASVELKSRKKGPKNSLK